MSSSSDNWSRSWEKFLQDGFGIGAGAVVLIVLTLWVFLYAQQHLGMPFFESGTYFWINIFFICFVSIILVASGMQLLNTASDIKKEQARFRQYEEAKSQANVDAERIMQSGGPQSLREYLHLFPNACPHCGWRRDITQELKRTELPPNYRGRVYFDSEITYRCGRCANTREILVGRKSAWSPFSIDGISDVPDWKHI
jgi:hypothetical protein